MMNNTHFKQINLIVDTVSTLLGRQAISRKVKNREEYFILDLTFSYFQQAEKRGRADYRNGYLFYNRQNKNYLLFVVFGNQKILSFFKKNFNYPEFYEVLKATAKYRHNNHYFCFKKSGNKKEIQEHRMTNFIKQLDTLAENDFAKVTIGQETYDFFIVGLGYNFANEDIPKIIKKSWKLFLWLYPSKPLFKRNATLNKNLKKIEKVCEITKIKRCPKNIYQQKCKGNIEGAHIKPHQYGGSDKLENGVWLCNLHHRLTERKIEGYRSTTTFNVNYVNNE
jgi:hypothetical protein